MQQKTKFWSTPTGWAAIILIMFASYFLVVDHGEHLFPFLPYLIFLLCPLMHVFMHKNHGHHHHKNENDRSIQPPSKDNNNHIRKGD